MTKKTNYRRLITLLLLVVFFFVFQLLNITISPCFAQSKAKDIEKALNRAEREQRETQKQINALNRKVQEIKIKEGNVIRQIDKLNNAMLLAENQIGITTLKKNKILARMNELGQEIRETNKRIDHIKNILKDRLIAIYKYGNVAEFNLFLSAPGAKDAMATSYLLGRIAAEDQRLIQELNSKKEKLNVMHTELAKQKRDLEMQNNNLTNQKNVLVRDQRTRNNLLKRVRTEKEIFIAQQQELLRASKELQNTIYSMLEKKKKLLAEQRGGKEQIYYKGGRLAWPLRGKITSDFGGRIHPVFKTRSVHTGIDIDGNKGDPVRAANDGEVLYAGWLRGYGQVIILDHGGSLTTVYAHLSKIDVRESAKVKRGDIVGRVGATGVATGPHLHFEVRVNGTAVNPKNYL